MFADKRGQEAILMDGRMAKNKEASNEIVLVFPIMSDLGSF